MRHFRAITALVVVLTVGACTGGGGSRDDTGTTPPPSSAPATTSADRPQHSFDIVAEIDATSATAAKPGVQFDKVATARTKLPDGRRLGVLDLAASGDMIATALPPPRTEDGVDGIKLGGQSQVGIETASGFEPFPQADGDCKASPRQAVYGSAADGIVTWMETSSTNLFNFDWCVFAYDQETKRTHLLGDSASLSNGDDMPPGPGDPTPSIGSDAIYWSTVYPTGKEQFEVKIVKSDRTGGGSFETAVDHAKLPAASGDELYYVRSADVTPDFPKDRYEIRRMSPTGDDVEVVSGALDGGQQVSKLRISESRISWVVSTQNKNAAQLYSLDLSTNEAIVFELHHPGASTMVLQPTPKLIAFSNGTGGGDVGEYVYDLSNNKLWRLGKQKGFSVALANGDYVAWAKLPEAGPAIHHVARWKFSD